MKVRYAAMGLLVLARFAPTPALAVDAATFKCEDKAVAAGNKWGVSRGKCLVKCGTKMIGKMDSSLMCTPPFDMSTQKCADAADAKYKSSVEKVCSSGMPACIAYQSCDTNTGLCKTGNTADSCSMDSTCGPATADQQVADQLAAQAPFIDVTVVPQLMCDPTLLKCEAKAIGALEKLAPAIAKCFSKCNSAAQLKGDSSRMCIPTGESFMSPPLDATTAGCITSAVTKAGASVTKACPTLPSCGLYSSGLNVLLGVVLAPVKMNYAGTGNPYCAM
jgi:hypothetical protein